jgi:hypothetical protein
MKFLRARYFANGGDIKHVKNRSISVTRQGTDKVSVCLQFKRADIPKEELGIGSIGTVVVKNKAEFTLVPLSREAALSLTMLLNDYWERVDKDWLESLKDELQEETAGNVLE